ncbi:unnamed protein product [Allacma fusca]|uniref:RRM domain-containing protein n=1 Tax=Allacma fusca TaxID=39272 RepID=A0A8J2PEX0_9HEXA|nr:unnamed protein product [Allacma fusca]
MSGKEIKKIQTFDEGLDSGSDSDSSDSTDGGEDSVDARLLASAETDSDTSESASDMEVDVEEVEKKLTEINEKLLVEPYNYDLNVEKIRLLRSVGDYEALRNAREKMSVMYPLSERLWVEWIQDEIKVVESAEEKTKIKELFERAVQDYLSVEIWLEYMKFGLSQMGEENGMEKCREICERALAVAGLHVSLGSLIWDAYRDFEGAVLGLLVAEDDKERQEKRYITLCRRQIAVPLLGMEESFEDISAKIDIDEAAQEAYSSALKKLESIEGLEQELVVSQDDPAARAAVYKRYIEIEKADKSNPARIQCMYERAVADCPLDSSLWLEYILYISTSLKIPEILLNVAERASRNCPWVMEIWAEYFNVVERHSSDRLLGVFEKAILNFAVADQAGTIWIKYLESLRRLLRVNGFPKDDIEKFGSNTVAAENHILQLSAESEPNEYVFTFNMMRLRLLASKADSMKEVRDAWKDLLQRGYGYSFRNWLQYLLLESQFGDTTNYRQQLSRAVAYVKDDLQSVANLWLNFERDEGDISHLKICEKKINKFLQELNAVTEIDSRNEIRPNHEIKGGRKDYRNNQKKRKIPNDGNANAGKKIKTSEDVTDGVMFKIPAIPVPSTSKENKHSKQSENHVENVQNKVQHDSTKDSRTVFVSNLDFSVDENDIRTFFTDVGDVEEVRLVKNFLGKSKGYAYVVFSSADSVPKAIALDRKALSRRPVFVSRCDPDKATRAAGFKYPVKLEKNKLFVKGLAVSVSEDTLKNLFSSYGKLKDVRLATHRNGYSKGHAYIDFEDQESAGRALKELDGKEVEGKAISVAISNPPPKTNQKDLPSDMLILQRKPPTAFVPRSLQVHKTTPETDNGPKKPMTNEDFKKFFKSK